MLNSKQRRRLGALAQSRACLVTLGRGGPSPEFAQRLSALLDRHELVKLRFGDHLESKAETAARLAEATGSEVVRIIGNVAVFWRRNPDPEKRSVETDL
jgi:RNA-binding protein